MVVGEPLDLPKSYWPWGSNLSDPSAWYIKYLIVYWLAGILEFGT